ncbi:MAG TPA: tetratricopeptide repeat protein [Candidatus Gastranaerophilaceae bacterium]|nr:tetratricopeptide repeat protein [Candidatus Gastranaerophilaceae bacterium]
MINKIKAIIFEYLKTFLLTIVTMFIVLVVVFVFAQHSAYNSLINNQAQDDEIEYYLIGMLIDKNKYLEEKYPKNYKINLKLGILYEVAQNYANSEQQYKMAMAKAPFDEFLPTYRLANLYIKLGKINDAEELIAKIQERPNKALINYKGEIYNKLGDYFYNQGDYKVAIEKYEKALFYNKILKSDNIKNINNSIASAYVYLADEEVYNMKIQDAIETLKAAISLVDAPILKYKLALLFTQKDPELAYQYFEEVFKKEPSIINYDFYEQFLLHRADEALAQGQKAQSDLMQYRAKKFKEYYQNNILSVDDVSIEYCEGNIIYNKWTKKYTVNLEMQLKNTSQRNLNSLFVQIIFKDENREITNYFEQVVDKNSVLKAGSLSPIINIQTSKKEFNKTDSRKTITAEIYVSKLSNSYKLYLTTIPIKEQKNKSNKKTK